MSVNEELLQNVNGYIENLFRLSDPVLEQCLEDADAAGLPPIQISGGHGKLLQLIARISGARRILEIGTLGGYSAIWMARALPIGGKLVTIEISAAHAEGIAFRTLLQMLAQRQGRNPVFMPVPWQLIAANRSGANADRRCI